MSEYRDLRDALGATHREELEQLLHHIEVAIRKYVVVDEKQLALLSAWVLHTWALEAFDYTPYLNIQGATSSVGKTLLAEVLEQLCWDGYLTGSVSESVLFRFIETKRPTLFLDELDKVLGSKVNGEAILHVLDTGFKRSGRALRNVPTKGGKWEAKGFSTFCPKAFQTIRTPPGELVNRSIPIRMKRKLPSETIARKRDRKIRSEFEPLRQQAENWAAESTETLRERIESDSVMIPRKLSDRAGDILEPLFAIADEAGPERGKRVRDAAVEIVVTDEDARHTNEIILEDVYTVFKPTKNAEPRDYVMTSELLEALNWIEDRTWVSWNRGDGMKAKDLARALMAFGGRTENKKVDGKVRKAYFWKDLEDAFRRVCNPHTLYSTKFPASAATNIKNQEVSPGLFAATVAAEKPRKSPETKEGSGAQGVEKLAQFHETVQARVQVGKGQVRLMKRGSRK